MTKFLPGWRAVVGGIETFTLEDNPNWLIDLTQSDGVAIWANGQRVIGEMLKLIKSVTTMLA